MAMFARRSQQRLLEDLKAKLSPEARAKLAHGLNHNEASALGYEWELALLFALGQAGAISYEADTHGGPSRPDITFAETSGPIRFVADVTTVSDAGLEEENPVMRFSQSCTVSSANTVCLEVWIFACRASRMVLPRTNRRRG
jgi:hypothetical protein